VGVPVNGSTHTCTAGAGSLVLEFGLLSRLVGDPVFEMKARRAVKVLWDHRDPVTGLVGMQFRACAIILMFAIHRQHT